MRHAQWRAHTRTFSPGGALLQPPPRFELGRCGGAACRGSPPCGPARRTGRGSCGRCDRSGTRPGPRSCTRGCCMRRRWAGFSGSWWTGTRNCGLWLRQPLLFGQQIKRRALSLPELMAQTMLAPIGWEGNGKKIFWLPPRKNKFCDLLRSGRCSVARRMRLAKLRPPHTQKKLFIAAMHPKFFAPHTP